MVSNWWNSEIQFFRYILPLNVITGVIYGIFKAILLAIIARSIYYEKRHHNKKKFKIWIHFTSLNSIHSFTQNKVLLKYWFENVVLLHYQDLHALSCRQTLCMVFFYCTHNTYIDHLFWKNELFLGEWPWISNIWCSTEMITKAEIKWKLLLHFWLLAQNKT